MLLASTVIDGAMVQRFFSEHLPNLSERNARTKLADHFVELVFASVNARKR